MTCMGAMLGKEVLVVCLTRRGSSRSLNLLGVLGLCGVGPSWFLLPLPPLTLNDFPLRSQGDSSTNHGGRIGAAASTVHHRLCRAHSVPVRPVRLLQQLQGEM